MEPGRTQTKVCKNTDSSSGLNTFLRPIKVNSDQKTNNLSLLIHHAMVKTDILFPLTKTYFVSSFTRYFLSCLLKNFKLPIFQLI